MKVSEGAWHITVVRRLNHDYRPRDLCSHFWTVQGALAVWAVFGLLITAAASVVVGMLVIGFIVGPIIVGWPWTDVGGGWFTTLIEILYFLLSSMVLLILLGAVMMVCDKRIGGGPAARKARGAAKRKMEVAKPEAPLPPPKPSILLAFLRAKKRKVCPLIELVPETQAKTKT